MVSKLKPTFVTDEFISAVADSLATGNAITLTTAVASATTYTDEQLVGLNYAGSQSATKNLTTNLNSAVVKADTNTIVIDVDLVNQSLNSEFQISTVLINATYKSKNILVGVVRFSTPELFPAYDNISVYELEIKLYISVSRIADAKINVNSAGMATAKSVQDLRTYVDGDFNADIARKTKDNIFTGTNTFNKKIIAPAGVQGNADTATKLQTPRKINGVSFDGSSDILIDPTTRVITSPTNLFNLTNGFYYNYGSTNTNAPADATSYYTVEVIQTSSNGYMVLVDSDNKAYWNTKTGNAWQQWKKISDDTKAVHNSGDEVIFGKKTFSNGIIASLTGNADTASKLQTPRAIGGVPFDGGSNIDLPGVNKVGNQDTSGRAANATNADHANNATNADLATKAIALNTPRKINGANFDGTGDINVPAANDSDIVHKSGNETVNGDKTFNGISTFSKQIRGSFFTPVATFTDFATVAANMNAYAGQWRVGSTPVTNSPVTGVTYYIVEVIPDIMGTAGIIRVAQYGDSSYYYNVVNVGKLTGWHKIAQDETVLHLSGDETAAGFKKFSGNIATTSDNSMINGGGNNGDIALVKKNGIPGFLAVGTGNSPLRIKTSNNATISPSDTFTDMLTVDKAGVVKAGTQQDLVPLDKKVAHNSGDETWSGHKTFSDEINFNKLIDGALKTREATFTDFATVASDMVKYAGLWFVNNKTMLNSPVSGTLYGVIEVLPAFGNATGIIRYSNIPNWRHGIYVTTVDVTGINGWEQTPDNSKLVHNTGKEDIFGIKSLRNGAAIYQGLELFDGTPYVDFHFNNDTADYTSRIIEIAKGILTINGVNMSGGTISGTLNGNASSATKLATARNINGVGFDGTSDITVDPVLREIRTATDLFKLANGFYLNAGVDSTNKPTGSSIFFTIEVIQNAWNGFIRLIDHQGKSFWTTKDGGNWGEWHQDADNSTVVHNSGNEMIGGSKTFSSTINGNLNGNSTTATKLQTARKIGGVSFDGSADINLPGVNTTGNQDTTGNAATATKLRFARRINGVSFDGSDDISVNAANDSNLVHKDNTETLSGDKTFNGVATFAKGVSKSVIKKSITASDPKMILDFHETAFGAGCYAHFYGQYKADAQWKTLATLPDEITPPYDIVVMDSVSWAGIPGVTYRAGFVIHIAIKPNREITYKVESMKDNDNTAYDITTGFDMSGHWTK